MTEPVWGPLQQDIGSLLADHPADVPAVVDHLTKLQDVLERVPPLMESNPLADFNKLYLRITTRILEQLCAGGFANPQFLSRLDVEFATRYFDALRLFTDRSSGTPAAWAVLFDRMDGPDARPLPSAAAGVNAHINFDLPFALVTTFAHLEQEPVDGSDQHRDYLQINDIFDGAIPELRRGFLSTWQLFIDALNGNIDDWIQGELVEYTRDVAWENGLRIWRVRHDPQACDRERQRLDRNATAVGRVLLSRLGAFLQ